MGLNSTEEIIEDIRLGKMVILMDDEDRENEGDLIIAAERIRPEDISFMARYACGLICLTLSPERCERLNLPLMVQDNKARTGTAFTVSIEAAEGVTTGISAADRAKTVLAAVAKNAGPNSIVQPGHIFPLKADPAGVLNRAGHTEAGCDLARLAGYEPAAVIVEIMNPDGTMARRDDLEKFAQEHDLKIGTVADLIHYRLMNERTVEEIATEEVNTAFGEFTMRVYRDTVQEETHVAFVKGPINPDTPTLVRVCMAEALRDIFGVFGEQRDSWSIGEALTAMNQQGEGVLVLLEGAAGNDEILSQLSTKVGESTERSFKGSGTYTTIGTGSQILRDLGVKKMRLMHTDTKYPAMAGFDLEVVEFISPSDQVSG